MLQHFWHKSINNLFYKRREKFHFFLGGRLFRRLGPATPISMCCSLIWLITYHSWTSFQILCFPGPCKPLFFGFLPFWSMGWQKSLSENPNELFGQSNISSRALTREGKILCKYLCPFISKNVFISAFTTTRSWMPDYRSEIILTAGISKINFINIEFV